MHSVQEGLPRQSSTAWAQPPSIDRVMSLSPSKQTKKGSSVYAVFQATQTFNCLREASSTSSFSRGR